MHHLPRGYLEWLPFDEVPSEDFVVGGFLADSLVVGEVVANESDVPEVGHEHVAVAYLRVRQIIEILGDTATKLPLPQSECVGEPLCVGGGLLCGVVFHGCSGRAGHPGGATPRSRGRRWPVVTDPAGLGIKHRFYPTRPLSGSGYLDSRSRLCTRGIRVRHPSGVGCSGASHDRQSARITAVIHDGLCEMRCRTG